MGLGLLSIALRGFEALYMITVWEGFLILTGALSGNLVMDDARGRSWEGLGLYAAKKDLTLS